jgi:glycosyltransferase involved in cell wall biosynthesis
VSVIAHAVRGIEAATEEDGVRVHRILPAVVPGLSGALRRRGSGRTCADAYLYSRAVAAKTRKILDQEGLDIIQSPEHGAEGFVLATDGLRTPHVVRFHTPLFMVNQAVGHRLGLGGRVVDSMERATARRAILNTCASRALASVVAARFGISWDRIRVVPNAIDHTVFQPAAGQDTAARAVLYVGKVAPLKGVHVLAQAIPRIVARVPDVHIVIVGSDHPGERGQSARAEMLVHLRAAGVASHVTFLSPVERPLLAGLYQAAAVCVLPTLWDNFPNTCLEAMACGVPVVATAVGGLPEIIHDGRDGMLVPPHASGRLADAVIELLEHPGRRLEMGRAARRRILSAYTMERIARDTVAVYDEAIVRAAARNGGRVRDDGRPRASINS